MGNRNEITLEEALNTFVAENERPTRDNLQEWVTRYPQFQRDLVEFAVVWAEQIVLPLPPKIGAEAEKVLIDRAMSHVFNVAYGRDSQVQEQAVSDEPIVSLTDEAERVGMNAHKLAESWDLDLALLSKLNSRQLEPKSIPQELISRVGRLLQKPSDVIVGYLAKPPQSLEGKAFLSHGKPQIAARQHFADAVRQSSLDDKKKTHWLGSGSAKED